MRNGNNIGNMHFRVALFECRQNNSQEIIPIFGQSCVKLTKHNLLLYKTQTSFSKLGVPPLPEIRFYSWRPVHAPEWLTLVMLEHQVEVMALSLAGDYITLFPHTNGASLYKMLHYHPQNPLVWLVYYWKERKAELIHLCQHGLMIWISRNSSPNHCGRHPGKINGHNSTYAKVWRCTFGRITRVLMGKSWGKLL